MRNTFPPSSIQLTQYRPSGGQSSGVQTCSRSSRSAVCLSVGAKPNPLVVLDMACLFRQSYSGIQREHSFRNLYPRDGLKVSSLVQDFLACWFVVKVILGTGLVS